MNPPKTAVLSVQTQRAGSGKSRTGLAAQLFACFGRNSPAPILSSFLRIVAAQTRSSSVACKARRRNCIDHQRTGQRGQQQAELVTLKRVATGAPPKQIEWCLLDPILGFAPKAVELLIQVFGIPLQAGDDEAGMVPRASSSSSAIICRSRSQVRAA